jgi:hypothetical protein
MRGNFAAASVSSNHTKDLLIVSRNDIAPTWLLLIRGNLLNASYRPYPSLVDLDRISHVLRVVAHHQAHISVMSQMLAHGCSTYSSSSYRIRGNGVLNWAIGNNTLSEWHVQTAVLLLSYVSSRTLWSTQVRFIFNS